MYHKDSLVHLLLQILQMYKHSVFLWFSTECLLNLDDSLEKLALTYFDIADKLVSVRTANDILTNLKGMCVSYDLNFYYQTPYLNCENGELNLETRKLEPHNPLDRLYKVTSCEYDPDAKAPVFESMIQKLLPDAQTRKEFQKAIGLCVAKEQFVYAKKIFVILLGESNTGKTTLLNTICSVFGDYKAKIDNSILLQSKNEINRGPEFFDLIDSLFINSSEFDSRHSLDASRIKQLTGNTEISVRNNYSTTMTKFNMIGVIYVDSNQKPYFNDEAMFSRLRVFPFKVKITQKDPTLSTKLQSEKSGILNWILAGLDMLMKDGEVFETPEMLNEKNDYKDNMSIVTQFSKDCLQKIPFPGCREVTSTVYTTFLNWCKQNNFKPTSRPLFYDELEKTYPRKKSNKEYFTDIAFTPLGSLYSMMQEMSPTEFAKELRIRREEDEGDYLHKRSQYFGAAWPFFKKSANFGTIKSWPKFSDYIDYTAIMGIGSLMEDDYNAKSKLIQDFYQKHGLELTDAHFNKICDIWGVDEDKVKRLKVKYPKSMLDEKRT